MDIHNLELEVSCYATALYHEVNNRTLEEKLGVYYTIHNRVKVNLIADRHYFVRLELTDKAG